MKSIASPQRLSNAEKRPGSLWTVGLTARREKATEIQKGAQPSSFASSLYSFISVWGEVFISVGKIERSWFWMCAYCSVTYWNTGLNFIKKFYKNLPIPGEAFPTHWADIGLVDSSVVRADVVRHPVLPFKALLADGALKRLLVRMGQLVTVQVVDVAEGLAAHLAPVVLLDRFGGFLGHVLLLHVPHRWWCHDTGGNWGGCCGEDASDCRDVGRVAVVLPGHGGDHGYHGGGCLGGLLWPWHHFDTGVAGLMAPQVVAVAEGLVAVATNERCFSFVLLLYNRHWWPYTSSTGHIVLEEIGGTGRRLLVYLDGQDGLLVNLFSSCVKKWQQAVLGHLVLVVEGFIGLLSKQIHTNKYLAGKMYNNVSDTDTAQNKTVKQSVSDKV